MFCFTKDNRIGEQKRIRDLIVKGKRVRSGSFDILFLLKPDGALRLVVKTPKRLGNAVVRNRIRRRLKEIFRLHLPYYKKTFDMLIFPKQQVAHGDFGKLMKEFEDCLHSLNLL